MRQINWYQCKFTKWSFFAKVFVEFISLGSVRRSLYHFGPLVVMLPMLISSVTIGTWISLRFSYLLTMSPPLPPLLNISFMYVIEAWLSPWCTRLVLLSFRCKWRGNILLCWCKATLCAFLLQLRHALRQLLCSICILLVSLVPAVS